MSLSLFLHLLAAGAELQMRAEGESLLCQKKQIILDKFDALLKKLGGQELSANITMDKVSAEFKEAMSVSERQRVVLQNCLEFSTPIVHFFFILLSARHAAFGVLSVCTQRTTT